MAFKINMLVNIYTQIFELLYALQPGARASTTVIRRVMNIISVRPRVGSELERIPNTTYVVFINLKKAQPPFIISHPYYCPFLLRLTIKQ